jgi:hypothetical protein
MKKILVITPRFPIPASGACKKTRLLCAFIDKQI